VASAGTAAVDAAAGALLFFSGACGSGIKENIQLPVHLEAAVYKIICRIALALCGVHTASHNGDSDTAACCADTCMRAATR
jgi:hypothetical protein